MAAPVVAFAGRFLTASRLDASAARRYGFALLCTVVGCAVAAALHVWLEQTPLAPLFAAVAISAWYGGLRPGLLTAVLSGLAGAWLFLEPLYSARLKFPDSVVSLVAFLIVAVVIATLAEQSHRAVATAEQAQRRLSFLSEASAVLVSSLDYETTLGHVMQLAVPLLADWCSVNLVEHDGSITRLTAAHRDPAGAALLAAMQRRYPIDPAGPHPLAVAIRTGETGFYQDASQTIATRIATDPEHLQRARQLGTDSVIVVPMVARGRTLGALAFARTSAERRYERDDVELAELLARRAALAIDNARLFRVAQVSETRYRNLFEGSEDPIFVVDEVGVTLDVNPAAERMTGYSRAELLALRLDNLLDRPAEWVERELQALQTHGAWHGEVDVRGKDGTTRPVEARLARIELAEQPVYVVSWRDISERRAVERLQQEFIVMVTHDLKTPLTSIKGLAQLLRRRAAYNASQVEAIIAQSDHLERLINDLLDVARLEAGRLELQRRPVDLAALARATAAQTQATTRAHSLLVETPEQPVVVPGDATRLEQVLLNLLANAVKYAPGGGDIVVRVAQRDGEARVSVTDRGVGIPPEALPRLFGRFYRAESAPATGDGLGLGLYICKSLVEAHDGRIWAESEPEAGSTFHVALPVIHRE